jgi:hypothetical protein
MRATSASRYRDVDARRRLHWGLFIGLELDERRWYSRTTSLVLRPRLIYIRFTAIERPKPAPSASIPISPMSGNELAVLGNGSSATSGGGSTS